MSRVLGSVVQNVNILVGFWHSHSLFPITYSLFVFVLNAFLQVIFFLICWRVNDINSFLFGIIQRDGKLYKQKRNWKYFTDAAMSVTNYPLYVKYATNLSKIDGFWKRDREQDWPLLKYYVVSSDRIYERKSSRYSGYTTLQEDIISATTLKELSLCDNWASSDGFFSYFAEDKTM